MNVFPVLLLVLLQVQAPDKTGVVIERTVKAITLDTLNRAREIQRQEIVRVRGNDVAITDLTFGSKLLIRPDQRRVWISDSTKGEYSELSFDEVAAGRNRAIGEIRACRDRVEGTDAAKELDEIIRGLDVAAGEPEVKVETEGTKRTVKVGDDRIGASFETDPARRAPAWFAALAGLGAFHPKVSAKLQELDGLPVKGMLRYVLFLDRVVEQFEVTASRTEEIPDAEFEPPTGLKKVTFPGFEPPPKEEKQP